VICKLFDSSIFLSFLFQDSFASADLELGNISQLFEIFQALTKLQEKLL
jgi:hypothetical protein